MCKIQSHMVCQCSTSRKQVRSFLNGQGRWSKYLWSQGRPCYQERRMAPGSTVAVVVLHHVIFCLSQCWLSFLEGIIHLICELVNHFNPGQRLMWLKAHLGVSAGIEKKGCLLHGGVDMVVVGNLCQGEQCVPIILSFSNKDLQVLFQFLVDLLCWSVSLQVVGSRHHSFNSQQFRFRFRFQLAPWCYAYCSRSTIASNLPPASATLACHVTRYLTCTYMYLLISVLFIISVTLYISPYPQEDPYPFLFGSPARYVHV